MSISAVQSLTVFTLSLELPDGLPSDMEPLLFLDRIPDKVRFVPVLEDFSWGKGYRKVIFETDNGYVAGMRFLVRVFTVAMGLNVSQKSGFVIPKINCVDHSLEELQPVISAIASLADSNQKVSDLLFGLS